MIPRYSRPQMAGIWEPENYFRIQLDIEAYACEAQATARRHSREARQSAVREHGAFEVARIREIEREVHHETIAFLTNLAEHVGPEARFVHQGMTSSDVLDTCLAVQLKQAADMLLADLDALLAALKRRAVEHKYTPTVARSHGIHAEPTTFGLKLAGHCAEFARNRERLVAARKEIATCAISGAVGTFANIDPRGRGLCRREARPRARADLDPDNPARPPRRSFHGAGVDRRGDRAVRHRDPPSAAHRIARGRRNISRPGQKGSSAMPHKRNPVLSRKFDRAVAGDPLDGDPGPRKRRHCGTSATSRIPRSSGSSRPTRRSRSISRSARLTGLIDRMIVYPERMRDEPRITWRARRLAARAAGADPGRDEPRGRLPPRPETRDGGVARRRPLRRPAQARSGNHPLSVARNDRRARSIPPII